MSTGLINTHVFTKTLFDIEKFFEATKNQYRVVNNRPYVDKKGINPNGCTLTLSVLHDEQDYGVDKNGRQRENNLYVNFDVTVFNENLIEVAKKGSIIQLIDYLPDKSFVIGFDVILRFADAKVLKPSSSTVSGSKQVD